MKQRIITAVCAIAVLILILSFKTILLRPAAILVGLMFLYEFFGAFKKKYKTMFPIALIFSIFNYYLLFINDYYNEPTERSLCYIFITFLLFVIFAFIKAVIAHDKFDVNGLMISILGYVYSTVLYSFLYLLLSLGDYGKENLFYLLLLFAISWGADTGGYTIGCLFGKHKLCPALSPKKTYEGAIGGVIFSLALGFLTIGIYDCVYHIFPAESIFSLADPLHIIICAIGIIALSIFAQIGDFLASSFKRFVDIKDYSNIMPGHGGIVDRFDSVVFVAPVLFLLIVFFII